MILKHSVQLTVILIIRINTEKVVPRITSRVGISNVNDDLWKNNDKRCTV